MADNLAITQGTGTTIAADDIGGVLHQRVKLSQGADGSATDVSSAAPLNVTLANTGANATPVVVDLGANNDVTVSGTVTAVAQPGVDIGDVTINNAAGASAVNIQDGGNTITVDGTVTINAIPAGTNNIGDVDVLTLPAIPAGTNNIGDVDVLTINGVAPAFGTGVRGATVQRVTIATDDSVPVTGTFYQATQPVSAASLPLPTGAATLAEQQTQTTSLSVMDDWDNGASDGASVSGDVAHGTADAGEPVKIGGKALSADPTAEATGDRVNALFDLIGRQVMFPYSLKENLVSGAITTAMTGTTSTSLIGAPGSGLYNYITQITVSNAHGTVGTDVAIQDGSGGTTIYTIPAAAVYGGAVVTFPAPLKQPTSNTALYCANVTTGASTKVSASGFKSS